MEDNKFSTGIDMVEVCRIKKSVEKNPQFLNRFFGEDELKLFNTNNKYQRIAGNFAGKEAFSKSLGTGIVGFSLDEVQVLRNELNAPYLKFSGNALDIVQKRNLAFSISISHTNDNAIAIVIAYKI